MDLEELLSLIDEIFSPTFEKYGFKVVYQNAPHIRHLRVGLTSDTVRVNLLFLHERFTGLHIGLQSKSFEDDSGWVYFEYLVDYLLQRPLQDKEPAEGQAYVDFLKENLVSIGKIFEEHCEQIFPLFKDQSTINTWEADFKNYVRTENRRRYGI